MSKKIADLYSLDTEGTSFSTQSSPCPKLRLFSCASHLASQNGTGLTSTGKSQKSCLENGFKGDA